MRCQNHVSLKLLSYRIRSLSHRPSETLTASARAVVLEILIDKAAGRRLVREATGLAKGLKPLQASRINNHTES